MYRYAFVVLFGLAILWSAGCAPNKPTLPPKVSVAGTVNLDGKPMPEGEIAFGITGQAPSRLPIKDGAYAGQAYVGANQVEIFAYKENPPAADGTGTKREPSKINTIPEQFNSKTTLSAEVKAEGANEFKFDITSH